MKGAVCQIGSSSRPSTTTAPPGTRIAAACVQAQAAARSPKRRTRERSAQHTTCAAWLQLRIGRVAEVGGRCLENFVDQEQVGEEGPDVNGGVEVVDHLGA